MRVLLRSVAAVVAVLTACGGDPVGDSFADETSLLTSLGSVTVLGRFDVEFPLTVTRIERGDGRVQFLHRGVPHDYPGFTGSELQAVHVKHGNGDGVLVVRSWGGP
jgi:hypothetical protein